MVTFADGVRVALAGGGTGGHLFPAVAVTDRIRTMRPGSRFLLHLTGRASEASLPLPAYVEREVVASPRTGPGLEDRALFPVRMARAVAGAGRSLRRFRPHCVVGLGGYGSVATILAARTMRVPVILLEQNAVPGRANRTLAPFARAVGVAFPETADRFPGRARLTGNPVRETIPGRSRNPVRYGLDRARPVLGVVGGSLGASALNLAVAAAARSLARAGAQVLHAAGPNDAPFCSAAYDRAGVRARVSAFFRDMGAFYAAADLVLARAGGTTIAELAASGTPSVLVPLTLHADGHQHRNAESLARTGGALVLDEADLSPSWVETTLLRLLGDGARLADMTRALRGFTRPQATGDVADLVLAVAGGARPS